MIHQQGDKFKEAEEVFENLLNDEKAPLKPDQKMFNMMIYMYKKAGSYEKARKTFALMAERGIEQSTVTYNSLMSFETNYKEVSNIYDQVKIICIFHTICGRLGDNLLYYLCCSLSHTTFFFLKAEHAYF